MWKREKLQREEASLWTEKGNLQETWISKEEIPDQLEKTMS